MRAIPEALAARLASGATTLARAWAVTRTDGVTLGFTDHDRPLAFEGIVFEAASGLTSSAAEQASGLAADSHTVEGALRSDAIDAADIERGLFDGAEIRHWLVDWTDPGARVLLARGRIGEVRRGEHAFEAEVTGLAAALNRPFGRAFLTACGHRLGEPACGVDLTSPLYRSDGVVTAVLTDQEIEVSGLESRASRWAERGAITWLTGANTAEPGRVKAHRGVGGVSRLALWHAPAAPVAVGDALRVIAGCDKTPDTCRAKFANLLNFGGFPHMPGDDWATRYPNTGEIHDGGSIFGG